MASPNASPPRPRPRQKQRKIGSRSCDGCKIRKVKCTEQPPCDRCRAVGIECTFNKTPSVRGPRSLRAKTLEQIREAQQTGSFPSTIQEEAPSQPPVSGDDSSEITVESLVLRLCIYRLRLFPVWPIVAVEEVIAALHRDAHDVETFALAVAVGAATMAQLKLERFQDGGVDDGTTAKCLEAECQRIRTLHGLDSGAANLNKLRTSFFLHIYHENQEPGGTKSLLYLREAITLAQIMGLHRRSTYHALGTSEDRLRRRMLWLLFVTERGVAMLHKLPVVLTSAEKLPPLDGTGSDDEAHILPAFKKLVNLFWIFDQSRAFEILQDATDDMSQAAGSPGSFFNHEILNTLKRRLQDSPLDMENGSSDIQKADICVTRQWMQVLIWRATLGSWRDTAHSSSSAVVTGPIHIAQEFLDFISQLPSTALEAHGPAIEFKVYEIASAVADSVAGRLSTLANPRTGDILLKLQRILATTRGGNSNLLNLLAGRIAHMKGPSYPVPNFVPNPTPQVTEIEGLPDDLAGEWTIDTGQNPHAGDTGQAPPSRSRSPYSSPSPWLSLVAAAELEQQSISDGSGTVNTPGDALPLVGGHGAVGVMRSTMNWYTQPLGLLGQLYPIPDASGMGGGGQDASSAHDSPPSPGDVILGDMLTGQNWLLGLESSRMNN